MPGSLWFRPRIARRVCALLPAVALSIALAASAGFAAPWSVPTPGGTHPDDATWSDEFALPGFDRDVSFVLPDSGRLLVLGTFTSAPGAAARRAASWDGSSFTALGASLDMARPFAAIRFRDSLLVMGSAWSQGSLVGSSMLRWNGSGWEPFASTSHDVNACAVYQGDLVVGGEFGILATPTHYITVPRLARWNGTSWSGGFGSSSTLPNVRALLVTGDSLWIGGVGFAPNQIGVRIWTGTSLVTPGAGLQPASGTNGVNALVRYQGQVHAGGWFTRSGTTPLGSTVARFDGSAWVGVGHATGQVTSLVEWNGDLLALIGTTPGLVKPFRLEAGEWVPFGDATASATDSTQTPGAKLIVDGPRLMLTNLVSVGSTAGRGMAVYEAGDWQAVQQPWSPSMRGVLARGGWFVPNLLSWNGQLLLADASHAGLGGTLQTVSGIASWNGGEWSSFPVDPGLFEMRLHADELGRLVAGGRSSNTTAGLRRWNGSAWDAPWPGVQSYVTDFVFRADGPWIGGDMGNGIDDGHLFRWNGTSWAFPPGCNFPIYASAGINAMLEWNGKLVVGGDRELATDCDLNQGSSVFIQDGQNWTIPGGASPLWWVHALAEHEGEVVVGERAALVPDWNTTLGHAAKAWDGVAWRDLSSGALFVTALLSTQGRLFAGGGFLRADSSATWGVAEWDGARWNLLGSGMNGFVRSLAVFDGDLYASGEFGWANGKSSVGIARWRGLNTVGAPGASALRVSLSPARPNPASGAQRFAFTLPAASPVQLAIYDVSGRRVATLCDGPRTAGTHAASWDGRDADGAAAAPGLYFARLRAAGGVASATVVRVK